jgi:hypothetical protein
MLHILLLEIVRVDLVDVYFCDMIVELHIVSARTAQLFQQFHISSTESEILALDELVRELQHLIDILQFITGEIKLPIKIYVDNASAIQLLEKLKGNNKLKHINVRINYLREMIMTGSIELHFVPTNFNVADILTKALPPDQFEFLREILMHGHNGKEPNFESDNLHFALTALSIE